MRNLRKATLMVIFYCIAGPLFTQEDQSSLPSIENADFTYLTGDSWYRALLMGNSAGYLHSCATVEQDANGPYLRTVEEMSLKFDFGQGPVNISATTVTEYSTDLKPRRIRAESNEFGRPRKVEAVMQGAELHVNTVAGEVTRSKVLTPGPKFGSELIFGLAAAQGRITTGNTYSFQTFVPELEMLVDFDVVCLGPEKVTVNGRELDGIKMSFQAKAIGLEMTWWMDEGGNILRQSMPGVLGLVIEKVTEQEALDSLTPFVLADHIPVEGNMGDTRSLTYVRLKASSSGVPAVELIPECPLQHVAPLDGDDAEVTVQAETEEGLAGHVLPCTDPQLVEFLSATDIIQSDDPAIIAKAREIVGEETDAWEAAKRLILWVYREMGKVDHDPRPVTASECLTMMKGDCSEHATLLCALARAVGIPSKFVTGVVYLRDGYYYHAWNELYIGRWVSCDPTWGEITCNAGHLILASGSLTSESFARTNLQAVRCMGVLTLEVLVYRTKE
ncbi:MAG: transglutaminase-like domain-containing protein [Candidatus Zipacnadales bacterium]